MLLFSINISMRAQMYFYQKAGEMAAKVTPQDEIKSRDSVLFDKTTYIKRHKHIQKRFTLPPSQ